MTLTLSKTGVPLARQCTACGDTKPLGEFVRRPNTRSGVSARCAECMSAAAKEYRARRRAHEPHECVIGERIPFDPVEYARRCERLQRIVDAIDEHLGWPPRVVLATELGSAARIVEVGR